MFLNPKPIVAGLQLAFGEHVADLGSGDGAYSFLVADRIGKGVVYAVDIQKDLLHKIQSEAKAKSISNIETIWGNIEAKGGTQIANEAVHAVIVSNVLFQIENKDTFISEIARILKHKGRVVVVDWADSFGGMGPHEEKVVTKESARDIFEQKGFRFQESVDAGYHHYGIIFTYEK